MVHHRVHKSPPLVPILSQLRFTPLPPPPANLPKIHSDPIPHLRLRITLNIMFKLLISIQFVEYIL
jgi:hypothetical protein